MMIKNLSVNSHRYPQASNTDRRNRLKEDIVEAVECMKSWQADGGIVSFKDTEQVRVMLEQLEAKSHGDRDTS